MTILFRLLFAHIISDFFFQTDSLIKGKESHNKKRYAFLIFHSLTHALTAYLLLSQWNNWLVPVVVFVTHILMDYIKVEYMDKSIKSFLVDQFVHLAVIFALWVTLCEEIQCVNTLVEDLFCSGNVWVIATAYLLALKPTSVLLSLFTKKWTADTENKSLPNAGKWIGYLERTLILTFILTNNAEGIGFLLAAKSIFRFGDMNKAQEIKTTEYVMIGTLASFTMAILIGFTVVQLIK